jgi:hypothetical protein
MTECAALVWIIFGAGWACCASPAMAQTYDPNYLVSLQVYAHDVTSTAALARAASIAVLLAAHLIPSRLNRWGTTRHLARSHCAALGRG